MWELAANWHGKKNTQKNTHTQEIYTKQNKKCVFWDYLQWPRRGGGGAGRGGGGEESLTTFWRTSLC